MGVDGEDRPIEAAADEVGHDSRADAAGALRRAHDCDRSRPQHALNGCHRGCALTLLEAAAAVLGQGRRERDLQLAGSRADFYGESRVAERPDHLAVAGHHHGGELAHTLSGRRLGKLGEQKGRYPAALPVICHGERDFGTAGAVWEILAVSDHLPVVRCHGEEARAPARFGEQACHLAEVRRGAEKTERARLVGERAQERLNPVDVLRMRGPDVDSGTIAQRDVGFGGDDRHESTLARPVRPRTRTWPTRWWGESRMPRPRRRHTLVPWTVPDRP